MIKLYKQPTMTEADLCEIARVSTGRKSRTDEELIKHLIQLGHDSIWEHATMTFLVEVPIYTARQWMRHRIGSYTEKSGRYSEMEDWKFNITEPNYTKKIESVTDKIYSEFEFYRQLMANGLRKEEARQVLPLCTLTRFYWTVNLRSLMNFLSLRKDKHAQEDIRENAEAVYKVFEEYYPTIAKEWEQKEAFLKAAKKFYRTDDDLFDGDNEDQIYDYLRR